MYTHILDGLDNSLALVLSVVLAAAERVGSLLGGALLRVGLDGRSNAVVGAGSGVADLLGGGLLRVGLDGLLDLVRERLAGWEES